MEYDGIVGFLNFLTVAEASDALGLSVIQVQLIGSFPSSPPPRAPTVQPTGSSSPSPPSSPSWEDPDGGIVESLTTVAVLLGSAVLAICLSFWIKNFVNPEFQMMQTFDIALAAMDFCSDALFVATAFSVEAVGSPGFPPTEATEGNAATSLAWASLIFLIIAGSISFFGCLWLVHHYWKRRTCTSDDLIDWCTATKHSNLYGILAIVTIADIELIKLYPWRAHTYDGFPEVGAAIIVTSIALLEDLPQFIIQIIFVSTVQASVTAGLSVALTATSICWRVAKRSMQLVWA
jgi:hypothetical protein